MPSPVIRIAPNPSRFTVRSPPILKVSLIFFVDSAPNNGAVPATDNPTPPARLNLTNVRRSILFSMEQGRSAATGRQGAEPVDLNSKFEFSPRWAIQLPRDAFCASNASQ